MKNTNDPNPHTITLNFTGQIAVNPTVLKAILASEPPVPTVPPALSRIDRSSAVPRLAFSMKETAEILGINYYTVHRLLQRGLLRSSSALRTKIISRKEIERFLSATTGV